nr:4Fe-4S binding protein [Candidatus Sigynarchaeota archaeon]
ERHPETCKNCKTCVSRCHFNAMTVNEQGNVAFNASKCAGCGLCVTKCPAGAVKLVPRLPGRGTA